MPWRSFDTKMTSFSVFSRLFLACEGNSTALRFLEKPKTYVLLAFIIRLFPKIRQNPTKVDTKGLTSRFYHVILESKVEKHSTFKGFMQFFAALKAVCLCISCKFINFRRRTAKKEEI